MAFFLHDDRIAVLPEEVEETSASGLILSESAQGPLRHGVVTHVGTGYYSEGTYVRPNFREGDKVFWHRASGQPLVLEGTEYIILAPREVIGTTLA